MIPSAGARTVNEIVLFIKLLELAKVGFVTQRSAKLGIAGAQRVMGKVIRKIIGGMDKNQLLIIVSYIR